eukprot:scaffold23379_cov71-Phaeocystis_antarctica.AAC.3
MVCLAEKSESSSASAAAGIATSDEAHGPSERRRYQASPSKLANWAWVNKKWVSRVVDVRLECTFGRPAANSR